MSNDSPSVIRMLPLDVANKIAAGEVVERPASVVKELMENAIDAGATRIDLTVTAGGRKLVSVADNGSGMCRDDALMAPERQATSKIRTIEDVEKIATMGFRGEALASIASVSRFTLRTRRAEDDAGTEVVILGGTTTDVRDCGTPPGTVIEVRDLFYNVPARRAFLRSFQTEQAHVRSMFLVHAIAWPNLALSLVCDGDPVYKLRPAATLLERLRDLFGETFMEAFVPVDYKSGDLHVHGFTGLPSNTRSDYQGQYVFVNGRPSTAPVIQAAIREAYPRLEQGRRPVTFLFIDLPPEQVDVNVHPTKREVRFRATGAVRDAVLFALDHALKGTPVTMPDDIGGFGAPSETVPPATPAPAPQAAPAAPLAPEPFQTAFAFKPIDDRTFRPAGAPADPPPENKPVSADSPFTPLVLPGAAAPTAKPVAPVVPPSPPSAPVAPSGYSADPPAAPWTKFRLVGCLSSGYALLETEGGYTVVDPSAAHERVLYERLLRNTAAAESPSQTLLLPQTVEMAPLDAQRIRTCLPILADMGFEIEDFGGDSFLVQSMPEALAGSDAKAILEETAQALEEAGPAKGRKHWKEEIVAATASKSAVRTRKPLDERELVPILMELAACRMPYATSDGRPTMIYTSLRELNRKFGH